MRLHSPAFERDLRRLSWKTIRAEPGLLGEYKRAGREWWTIVLAALLFPIGYAMACASTGLVAGLALTVTVNKYSAMGAASYLYACRTFVLTRSVSASLNVHRDLLFLASVPLSDADLCRRQLERQRRNALLVFPALFAPMVVFGKALHFSGNEWVGSLVAVLVVLCLCQAAATSILAFLPGLDLHRALAALGVTPIVLCSLGVWHLVSHAQFEVLGAAMNALLPTGWPIFLLKHGGLWAPLVLLVPIWMLGRDSEIRLCRAYRYRPVPEAHSPEKAGAQTNETLPLPVVETAVAHREAEHILSRQFLQYPGDRGVFERLFARWLNEDESRAVEFQFPMGIAMTRAWRKAFLIAGAFIAAAFLARHFFGVVGLFGVGVIAYVSIISSSRKRKPTRANAPGVIHIVHEALLPIGAKDRSRLILKRALIQFPALLLLGAGCGMAGAVLIHWPALSGAQAGARVAIVLTSAQIGAAAWSPVFSGSFSTFLRSLVWVVCQVGVLCLVAAAHMFALVRVPHAPNIPVIVPLLISGVSLAIAPRIYARARFDLFAQAAQFGSQSTIIRIPQLQQPT